MSSVRQWGVFYFGNSYSNLNSTLVNNFKCLSNYFLDAAVSQQLDLIWEQWMGNGEQFIKFCIASSVQAIG